eukprot:Pgem_evm1s3922
MINAAFIHNRIPKSNKSTPNEAYPKHEDTYNNDEQHMVAAQQVIQYVSKTKHLKLQYYAKPQTTKTKKIRITCFADSSYAKLLPDHEILAEILADNESNEQIINGTAPVRRIRQEVQKGNVTVNWVESELNISDMMTKPLSPEKHSHI